MLAVFEQVEAKKEEMREELIYIFEVLPPTLRYLALDFARSLSLTQAQAVKNDHSNIE